MSTIAVIVIIAAAVLVLAVIALAIPRARANARRRELERRRGEVAGVHRDQASARIARAEEAEKIAARERAEADLHEARARLHERGLADDELDEERAKSGRFAREERGAEVPPRGMGEERDG
jgi:hypothetical protein